MMGFPLELGVAAYKVEKGEAPKLGFKGVYREREMSLKFKKSFV